MTLDNQPGVTYYRHVADIIKHRIYNGVYKTTEKLPSGRELSQEFRCNRHTIRRALDIVEMEDLIVRQQGRGTFVAHQLPVKSKKNQLALGLIDITHSLGFRPAANILGSAVQPAGEKAGRLNIKEDDEVTYIHRLRIIKKSPAIIENIYIPSAQIPNLIDHDLSQSLRDLMANIYNIKIAHSEVIFESILSNVYVSNLLNIPIGSAMMFENRTSYNSSGIIIEYSEHTYRGDQFSFILK